MSRHPTLALVIALGCLTAMSAHARNDPEAAQVRLVTLDPGHFHAALVQKFMYREVDPVVRVYAPADQCSRPDRHSVHPCRSRGDDLTEHLKRIDAFNSRAERPTHWREQVYTGPDFLQRMLDDKAGNVVVISGNNAHKADYILRTVRAGMNVLADKPMVIVPADLALLKQAFEAARANDVLLYDIMTERFEITSILQRRLSQDRALFGGLVPGTPEQPAITKESVHHFSKSVAGAPLKRPEWFFDVRQQGEGMVDVGTHLVDLVQWQAFPDTALQPHDATVLSARRWATPLTRAQYQRVTGAADFPSFLSKDLRDGVLHVFANGELTWRLRGVHARVSVRWSFEAPPGGGDTHFSLMRGSNASLVIRQSEAQQYRPTLYIENLKRSGDAAVRDAIAKLQQDFAGVDARREGDRWRVIVPDKYRVGHEAHFAQVTENFLGYLRSGALPAWETPNMLTKYSTLMRAYELSRKE